MQIYKQEDELNQSEASVDALNEWVSFTNENKWVRETVTFTRDEAIAAARAILAHFNVGVE